jgi:hypothetical protein
MLASGWCADSSSTAGRWSRRTGVGTLPRMAIMPRPFGASPRQLPVVSSEPLRRCTFRRVTAVAETATGPAGYEVACTFPDRQHAVPLGSVERARPICAGCTYQGIFRADSD